MDLTTNLANISGPQASLQLELEKASSTCGY